MNIIGTQEDRGIDGRRKMDYLIYFSIKTDTLGREICYLICFFFFNGSFAAVFIVLISKYIISLGQHIYKHSSISYSYPATACMPQMEPQAEDLLNPMKLKGRPYWVEAIGIMR